MFLRFWVLLTALSFSLGFASEEEQIDEEELEELEYIVIEDENLEDGY